MGNAAKKIKQVVSPAIAGIAGAIGKKAPLAGKNLFGSALSAVTPIASNFAQNVFKNGLDSAYSNAGRQIGNLVNPAIDRGLQHLTTASQNAISNIGNKIRGTKMDIERNLNNRYNNFSNEVGKKRVHNEFAVQYGRPGGMHELPFIKNHNE